MAKKVSPRVISANEFLAESLEAEAEKLPPSKADNATILRETAALYRTRKDSRLVRVWEEKEDVNRAAARIVREATERD
jgi:hypothetical protein